VKRVLFLTRIFPFAPAQGGDVSYTRGMIGALAPLCRLRVVTASNGSQAGGSFDRDGVRWTVAGSPRKGSLGSLRSMLPNIAWRGATPAYREAVAAALAETWDAVLIDHIGSGHVVDLVEAHKAAHPATRVAYVSHEHEASVRREKYAVYGGSPLMKAAMALDGWKVERLERRLVTAADVVSVINAADIDLYRRDFPRSRFVVSTPGYRGPTVAARTIGPETPRTAVLLGGRGSKQKQVILERWLDTAAPVFAARGVELLVVGPIDEALRERQRKAHGTVRFEGFVEDLEALLFRCRIGIVADFVGGGFKVRLLTYVFNRVPMFGLAGSISGLPTRAGAGFAEYADMEELAKAVCDQIDDFDRLNRLQDQAYRDCVGRFSWPERGGALLGALLPAPETSERTVMPV
jgi:glycosyltransferase involved in cell wall biosynthesis